MAREPLSKRRLLHPVNIILAAIAVAFTAWEIVAAVMDKGWFSFMVTLSEYVWWLRDALPFVGYPLIFGFCSWLLFHFVNGNSALVPLAAGLFGGLLYWLCLVMTA